MTPNQDDLHIQIIIIAPWSCTMFTVESLCKFYYLFYLKKKRKEKVDLCCHVGGVWVSFIGRIKENKVNDYVLLKETVDY